MKPLSIADDIAPLGEFKARAAKILDEIAASRKTLVVTRNGRSAAVVMSPDEYDRLLARERLMQSMIRGLADSQAGRTHSTEEVRELLAERRAERERAGATDKSAERASG